AHANFHIAPRGCVICPAMLVGASVYLDERFDAEQWVSRIRETGATVTIAHGPMFEMIHAQPETAEDASTNLSRIGAAQFPANIAASFERRFGVRVVDTWGMTEVGTPCWNVLSEELRPGACGKIAQDLYEFRIADPDTDEELPAGEIGEFQLRAKVPWIMSPGYLGDAEATVSAWRNLWFHSGDMGYRTPDGWIYFTGRNGDRIRRRGENISPADIEISALEHPDIVEASAIGVPSEFQNDHDVMLFVVLRKGSALSERDILVFLLDRIPHFMIPRYIEIRTFLPRNTTHKVQKQSLREDGVSEATWDRKMAGIKLSELYESRSEPEGTSLS
ncbi:MAG: AMP-binding protein, partial [Rhizobiaceae bacterium]|nr:AMP-binding protein [Rhizobiaceae bacterium]